MPEQQFRARVPAEPSFLSPITLEDLAKTWATWRVQTTPLPENLANMTRSEMEAAALAPPSQGIDSGNLSGVMKVFTPQARRSVELLRAHPFWASVLDFFESIPNRVSVGVSSKLKSPTTSAEMHPGGGDPRILLHPATFQEGPMAPLALGHELGHVLDYFSGWPSVEKAPEMLERLRALSPRTAERYRTLYPSKRLGSEAFAESLARKTTGAPAETPLSFESLSRAMTERDALLYARQMIARRAKQQRELR